MVGGDVLRNSYLEVIPSNGENLLAFKTTMTIEKTQEFFKVFGFIFFLISSAKADQVGGWNRFRGPHGSGVAVGCQPPVRVGKDCEAWRVPIPQGLSSPVLSESQIFLTAVREDELMTIALDKQSGKELWRRFAPVKATEKVHRAASQASSTVLVDEQYIIVYFGSYGLLCYDHDGNEVWKKPIPTPQTLYGMASSPIVFGEMVIMVLDDDRNLPGSKLSRSRVVAYEKATGKEAWKTARPFSRSGWSTPIIWYHKVGTDLVVLGDGRLNGYDPKTGEGKWHTTGFSRETIAVPVANRDHVFASSSRRGGDGDAETNPKPFWDAILPFDKNKNGKIERSEMKVPFTFPFRPELPVDHPGFGFPMPVDLKKREERVDWILSWFDKNKDQAWSEEEFMKGFKDKPGKPLLVAVRPGGSGNVTETHASWSVNRNIPEIPSPLLHNGIIYLIRAGGVLAATDAQNGEIIYRNRISSLGGQCTASPVYANGHLYLVASHGVISVVATGRKFREIHSYDLGEESETTPAIDRNSIYIRTGRHLISFRKSK
ncbi:PQQ-binding-like beta-propeller repeat protein [bacterium]|nr:PQQ-binding-like beta-propeller repeat protein [bacterium]